VALENEDFPLGSFGQGNGANAQRLRRVDGAAVPHASNRKATCFAALGIWKSVKQGTRSCRAVEGWLVEICISTAHFSRHNQRMHRESPHGQFQFDRRDPQIEPSRSRITASLAAWAANRLTPHPGTVSCGEAMEPPQLPPSALPASINWTEPRSWPLTSADLT
jgi:hypothetical protein